MLLLVLMTIITSSLTNAFDPKPDIGLPSGLVPDCPGAIKNATIRDTSLPYLQVTVQRLTNKGVYTRSLPIATAHKSILSDKHFDLNKKTVFYAVGFWDSSVFPPQQSHRERVLEEGLQCSGDGDVPLPHIYLSKISVTVKVASFMFWPRYSAFSYNRRIDKSVRLVRIIGRRFGELLVKLTQAGLRPENIELVGTSLGAHIASHAAKYYISVIGKKPSRLTGLDPAGPCFRGLPAEEKVSPTDADHVDVLHTNIDGFGIAERLGHVDFYANGGEYQPGDIPYIPCLVICSHSRSLLYWWQALENPKRFIGVKCGSIQEARSANCYNNTELNYLGLDTNFKRSGIFYLPTNNEFPYHMGKEGLKPENEIYKAVSRRINADDDFRAV
ncbi:unnamed protein product [Leptosia nina]|uniref:Lipase domain-containing protein n=1 Tax=Leptosia nina TaxID=320188 RepID=A0AAV1J2M2_9NEOP